MPFQKGRKKTGGRKPGGMSAQKSILELIRGALDEAGGQAYLLAVAQTDPRTFVQLVGRSLPMTLVGDKNNPLTHQHQFEVTLKFGNADANPQRLEAPKEKAVETGDAVDLPKPVLHWPEK